MEEKVMELCFGFDFGTSNSTLSINNSGQTKLIDIDDFSENKKTFRSIIYYNPDEKKFYYGQKAVDLYIENDAYGRYIQSIKSFLPDSSFSSTEIGGRVFKLEELIGLILRKIKKSGEYKIKKTVDKVVLGRPVVFSEDCEREKLAVKRLLSAAKIAGFNEVHLQYEPIAAALAFESTLPIGEEKIVLVGDFGGGTSDFTVIKTKGGKQKEKVNRKNDILGLSGVYIGGDSFDSQLMWEKVATYFGKDVRVKAIMNDFDLPVPSPILSHLRKWHLIPQLRLPKIRQSIREIRQQADKPELIENLENLIDDNYGYVLFRAIEKAKCELSTFSSTSINFGESHLRIRENISRQEFEEFIVHDVEKIKVCVDDVIRQSGISENDVDIIFLTGGSSHIPIIKRIFSEKFGDEKINQTNAFTSVAYGLGVNGNLYI